MPALQIAVCFKSTARRTVTAFPRGAWERAECLKIFGVVGADLTHQQEFLSFQRSSVGMRLKTLQRLH